MNPALESFIAAIAPEILLAQVRIRRTGPNEFALTHLDDADDSTRLRELNLPQLRDMAQLDPGKQFRPLKSAPTLTPGWRFTARSPEGLWDAINVVYPGAIADWFAARRERPPITDYRPFTERQTGMYRITAMLSDISAAQVARACCHPRMCLKQRLWTVGELAQDSPAIKSAIPCLEPCALLMELARKAMRMEQSEPVTLKLSPEDLATVAAALDRCAAAPVEGRVADYNDPLNPRRVLLVRERLPNPPAAGATSE